MGRDVSLAIGVADADPLVYLSGAINGALSFQDWASKSGYDAKLLTDEEKPVTVERLRSELDKILEPNPPIHRFILYFAGHGLIRNAEEGLWLLSDWYKEQRAVAVEVLRRRLYRYQIEQITIISDSCCSLPTNIDTADLALDPVLGKGPHNPIKYSPIDKFIAAQDGSPTFMVPGQSPSDDRCLFSGLLIEALWGTHPKAFSGSTKKITGRSLGAFLQENVPELAATYKLRLMPDVNSNFPEGDDIYFGPNGAYSPPIFPKWLTLQQLVAMGVAAQASTSRSKRAKAFLQQLAAMGLAANPVMPDEETVIGRNATRDDTVNIGFGTSAQERTSDLSKLHSRSYAIEPGIKIEGGQVQACWSTSGVLVDAHSTENDWAIKSPRAEPLLIEFSNNRFAAVTAMPYFEMKILRSERGISSVTYSPVYRSERTALAAEDAIAKMETSVLRFDEVTDLATNLRGDKHNDPMLGVISAYLYDSIGDIGSIRRMAYYYTHYGQPIPYDIALLAELLCGSRNGIIEARVPAVEKREPRTEAERRHEWTHSATLTSQGQVGGHWPWMRQGWMFLEDLTDLEKTLVNPELLHLVPHLRPGTFTMLDVEGGLKLAKLFGLIRQPLTGKRAVSSSM